MKFSHCLALCALSMGCYEIPCHAVSSYTVTSIADSGAGSLRSVIQAINQSQDLTGASVTFAVSGSCSLASQLPPLLYPTSFSGGPFYVYGSNLYRGLMCIPGPSVSGLIVNLSGLSFQNCAAIGGSGGSTLSGTTGTGGGGGAGLGGGLFVGPNTEVTFTSGNFLSCVGQGGLGGTCLSLGTHSAGAGGGGMGGSGGGVNNLSASLPVGAGGGGGLIFKGGNGNGASWGAGGGGSGGPGQDGSSGITQTGLGGTSTPFGPGGNGGNGTNFIATNGSTFGGGGGDLGLSMGGMGGFGAGGGGGGVNTASTPGGLGGFGAGGGGAGCGNLGLPAQGGAGGYGGGGGGGVGALAGVAGFGAANGKPSGAGGGGAGLGGALFIHQSAVCNLIFSPAPSLVSLIGNSVTVSDSAALAIGPDIFMMGGATLNLNNQQGSNYTFANPIVSDYLIDNSLNGGISVSGSNSIILSGSNTFTGGIEVLSGTLSLGPLATLVNLNPLVVVGSACFDVSSSTLGSNNIGQIISSGGQDGLVNIGSSLLNVGLFNDQGSFLGSFQAGPTGQLAFFAQPSGTNTCAFTYSGSSSNFLGTVTVNPNVSLYLAGGGNFNTLSTYNVLGTLDASLLSSNANLGAIIGTGTFNIGSGSVNITPSYPCAFNGAISGSNTMNVNGNLSGAFWTLGGSSTFTGTIGLGSGQGMGLNGASIPALFNLASLSTLQVQGSTSIGNLAGYGNVQLIGVGSSLTFKTNTNSSFYGAFGPSNGTIAVTGSGSLALYGDNSAFTGPFVVDGGTLFLKDNGQLPQNIIINQPGILDISQVGPLVSGNNVNLSSISGSGNVSIGSQNIVFVNITPPVSPFLGNIVGSGNITFSGANPFLLGGNLNTTGTIFIDPVGVTLSGSASISPASALVFANGTLSLGSVSSINLYNLTGTGTIVGGSCSISLINNAPSSFTGTMSSNGTLSFLGPDSLTLNAQGPLSANVQISNGTLTLLNGGYFQGAASVNLQTPAILNTSLVTATISNLNSSGLLYHGTNTVSILNTQNTTLSGTLSGSGTVSFQAGSTTLLTDNFYSDSPIESLAPFIMQPSPVLTFNNTLNVYSSVNVAGSGFTFINGTALMSSLSANSGQLVVNGALNVGSYGFSQNAVLSGLGQLAINGTFLAGGVIAPGFNPMGMCGTLTLNPSLGVEFLATSALEVTTGSECQDFCLINGACQIDPGASLVIRQQSPLLTPYETYTILEATLGRSGQFSNLISNMDPSQIQIVYGPNTVDLYLQARLNASGNAKQVANILNQNMLSSDPEVVDLLTNLLQAQAADQGQSALDQLQPSALKSTLVMKEALLTNVMLGVIKECELDAITNNLCACRLETPKAQSNKKWRDTDLFSDMPSSSKTCKKPRRGHLFIKGLGSNYFQQNHGQNSGYKSLFGGAVVGGRYVFGQHLSLSGALAYQTGTVSLYKNRGKASLNQRSFMALVNYDTKRFEGALGYAYGANRETDTRKIRFQSIDEDARNQHSTFQQAGFLKLGLFYPMAEHTSVGPYDYLSFIHSNQQGFKEHGAGVCDLVVDPSHGYFFRNELGVRFNTCLDREKLAVKAFLKAAYVQEVRYKSSSFTSSFLNIPGTFTTQGYTPTRALGLLGFGLNTGFGQDRMDFGVIYDVEACHDYVGQRFELGFSFHF